ncbi:GspE/PulE family protein [Gimesia chilikensis]|jgi:general secretion pathway protein E/type IV pilus assembly protein PilB|uniref:Type II secretion system protein E n=1 Tax=Gimesia chilikensis TaxID=2605989 RepID=A0A517PW20_9PLAN|nr:ATPase, T2SS/T4P/T4SS family [Gimesia chilikensis]MBN71007.1 general secretion pathway protein GspE [Gimesia sp.]MCR9233512.1 ATPase, T2SS/T4P/T4SS family [bacterium]QDT23572.1 Type II secretion system protein E [Gimesia chilikensis]QDT87455.1 Type II secretion system protein E [Gimesia chilikensis]
MEISDILQRRGILDERQLLLAQQSANGHRLDRVVMDMGLASEEDLLKAFADELGMKYFELKDYQVDTQLLSQFPATPIFRHSLLPLQRENGRVLVASADPFDFEALDELSSLSGEVLEPVLALHEDVVDLIKQNLGVGGDTINELVSQKAAEDGVELLEEVSEEHGELADMAQTASVIRLVNELLVEALQQQASDVHIEPHETGLVVRYRVDGLLRVQSVPPEINHFYSAIITRLKIMAHLNIAEKRLPQDGRIKLRVTGREIDVRVSIIPMIYGEGVVLRLLDKERMVFRLDNVGLNADMLSTFREMIELPHGIILVTGPTGSGKTSTLYSALNEIKSPETKIITVEDPVEYHSEGISQIQVNSRIGLTFAAGLRSILRHDPDVVLIGEIRDGETANSAIQASLTGHLVFSTLHTNDSPGAFTRLVDMGVEAYLVASTVEAVLAQRLVRVLCKHCKRPHQPHPDKIPPDFPLERMQEIYEPVGCRHCREMGYSGRIGILELLINDPVIRKLCTEHASSGQIRDYARKNGWQTLRDAGWEKVLAGITSIDEILRVTKGDI